MKAKEIDRLVSKMMKVPLVLIKSKGGNRKVSEARFVDMYLRRKHLQQSYNALAKEWGYSNHTVTMSGVKNVINHLETEKLLKEKINYVDKVVEHRLKIICFSKKRYNDHYRLKLKGISVNARQKIISVCENTLNDMYGHDKKMVNRLIAIGYGLQLELSI